MHAKRVACAALIVVEAGLIPSLAHAAGQEEKSVVFVKKGEMTADAESNQIVERPSVERKTGSEQKPSAVILETVNVNAGRTQDEKGHDDVYMKNVTTVFKDRKELSNFQVTNPGDVFKGMNGVYNMDTRSSQAITPNIRGISGEGRVPVLIDGTEQSTNIWLHMFGAGNRSYADPALFRSIEVEKGPSLSRGIKSGVGGAVNIRTIEANDIIPKGKNFGIEIKLQASGNTSKPGVDAGSYVGKDYRDIPGAERRNTTEVYIPYEPPHDKGDGEIFNFDNHTGMVAVAGRNELTDFLVSYSKHKQGNYYAGKNNADKYTGHDAFDRTSTDSYFPNLTKLYHPGNEVFNTSSETKTTLVKNNWYLPNEQKIGLQFMRTDLNFGETTPGDSVLNWAYREAFERAYPNYDWATAPQFVYEKPHSELQVDRYKLSYDFKPEGSDWLNLETSLWHTKTSGTRYQTGSGNYGIAVDGATEAALSVYDQFVAMFPDLMAGVPPPDHDGTIVSKGKQWTNHDRTGFDFSNQMKLTDRLRLTVGSSYQQEKLDDKVQQSDRASNGIIVDGNMLHATTDFLGPREGERKEYSAMFNLDWQATDWLTLTAGTRYMHYSGKDTGLAKRRASGDARFAAVRRLTGVGMSYYTPLTDQEIATNTALWNDIATTSSAASPYLTDWVNNGTVTPEISAWLAASQAQRDWQNGRTLTNTSGVAVWLNEVVVPVKGGKMDASQNPFANGEIDANTVIVRNIYGTKVYERLDQANAWEMPAEQSGSAWSPVLSATARITSHGTTFVRYAQTTRFPNIYELTSSSIIDGGGTQGTLSIDGASKPERSSNWEIGYAHDLTQFFPNLELADARISYYNTEIKNYIERTIYLDTIQFDKKKTSGIELQSRFDTGRFFGSLGSTYRLKQKLCDKDFASGMDPFYNRISSCMTGGFPGTYSGSSLQPKYSIDMALGARFLNQRLEMGWRGVYHAAAENKQLDRLLSDSGISTVWFRDGAQGMFYWKPVLLHDVYARFEVNKHVSLNLNVTNLTDQYYLDPMAKTLLPGPGRTVFAGMTIRF